MIPEVLPESQDFNSLIDEEKIFLEEQANKLYIKHLNKLPHFDFDNNTVTSYGNFVCIDKFKEINGLKDDIVGNVNLNRGSNTTYSDLDIIEHMINNNILGNHCFAHYNNLANDPGFIRITENDTLPDESTCRKALNNIEIATIDQLKQVMNSLNNKKAELDGPREVWISIDDSVSELYGNQENSSKGYNPKRKGAASYKIKVAFIQDTDELVNISLYPGNVHSNGDFIEFFEETINGLPSNTILKGVLVDRGFFSEENCKLFEEKGLLYLLKAKMYKSLKKHVLQIPEDQWQYVGSNYWVAEKRCRLDNWDFERRFVFIRQEKTRTKKNKNQLSLPAMETYFAYQAIVTNIEEDTSPEDCWHQYNQRAIVENKIEELKNGYAVDKNSQNKFLKNYFDILIKSIAYNLLNWFKHALLPANLVKSSIRTIRRIFINIPANIVKKGGRKLTVRLPNIDRVKQIIAIMKERLFMFAFRQCYNSLH